MSRFGYEYEDEGIPWALWDTIVSNALAGRRGQEALAELEEALLALPAPRLVQGHLASGGEVCAVGAYVARRRAQEARVGIENVIAAMGHDVNPDEDEPWWDTVQAGIRVGLAQPLAWQLAYLNDEQFHNSTPEGRYEGILQFVRRAQGKVAA